MSVCLIDRQEETKGCEDQPLLCLFNFLISHPPVSPYLTANVSCRNKDDNVLVI